MQVIIYLKDSWKIPEQNILKINKYFSKVSATFVRS